MIPTGDEEGAPAHFVILSLDENGEEASRLGTNRCYGGSNWTCEGVDVEK